MRFFYEMLDNIARNIARASDHELEEIEAFRLQQYANGEQAGRQEGFLEGTKFGIEEGIKQCQSTIIINMFNMGQNVDSIHKLTGISKDVIKSVLNIS